MNGRRSQHKRCKEIDIGGMNCPCCGPAPGGKRKRVLRSVKRREKRDAMREATREAAE